ncbi:protein-(glutamine-N5) methyltransferase, release factor-specific [Coriobacterium glomerans PW2]|uniref:Release factor glutamine methyltransferase n=1 Tax=Coriobacterium glomerans (strain ATCC 49209 / DSM 20642 / JCM 10262 / PW2) TaxID=700015 RepID=F2NAB9_CORGP|nr:protein-(glutamine-N5) methyltransferase, release factor-specific [Coriobacterium glomerans PW2]
MAAETWTIKRCLDWTERFLAAHGEERPRLAAEWLLSAATGLARIELYMSFDRPLGASELDVMHRFVARRSTGEPLQYITEQAMFRTIAIACEPGVLIPRPETEVLVGEVLAFLDHERAPEVLAHRERVELPWNDEVGSSTDEQGMPNPSQTVPRDAARILEIGCGTGCISLAIASERPGQVKIVATDIDPSAVALAQRNRVALGLDEETISFREGDLAEPVAPDELAGFDVLVSNPPYIPRAVMADLPREVSAFEPELALDGGADGLQIYRRLLRLASMALRPGGLLACELYEESLEEAAELARGADLVDVSIVEDLAGRPRVLLAHAPARSLSTGR